MNISFNIKASNTEQLLLDWYPYFWISVTWDSDNLLLKRVDVQNTLLKQKLLISTSSTTWFDMWCGTIQRSSSNTSTFHLYLCNRMCQTKVVELVEISNFCFNNFSILVYSYTYTFSLLVSVIDRPSPKWRHRRKQQKPVYCKSNYWILYSLYRIS